jgi:hypothetical protein
LDDIEALWLARKFGAREFVFANPLDFSFDGVGGTLYRDVSADIHEQNGILLIGVGAGEFDEHPGPDSEGEAGESASSLMAKRLGVENDPALRRILDFTRGRDAGTLSGHWFDIHQLAKDLHYRYPDDSKRNITVVMMLLEAKYCTEQAFAAAQEEVLGEASWIDVQGHGRALKLAVIESDNHRAHSAAMNAGADIVVCKRTTGNMQIYTTSRARLDLSDLAAMLRFEESCAQDQEPPEEFNVQKLSGTGVIEGVPEWFLHQNKGMILNGSTSHPGVPPTKLATERIVGLIAASLNPQAFDDYVLEQSPRTSSESDF